MKSISVSDLALVARLVAVVGCGLMAGVFFAFSTFVMKALARLPAETGIAAIQSINAVAVKSWFLAAFLATAAACTFVLFTAFGRWGESSANCLLAGCAVFLIGTFLVTVIFNVPMNNALAALPSAGSDHAAHWGRYVAGWTAWNHVRTITSLAAAVLLLMGWFGERRQLPQTLAIGQPPITRHSDP
jgi:uncharacterized membrane protein